MTSLSSPSMPLITLQNGEHRVAIFDPRADPRTLGARYVHGGYIAAWHVGERCLTAGPTRAWMPFGGLGLPETFELPLAWAVAEEGDYFMRIGAGQLRKRGLNVGEEWTKAPLTSVLNWTVTEQSAEHITMTSGDSAECAQWVISYTIERTVRVLPDGVESRTTLQLSCPRFMHHPISWFAHPFFVQSAIGATSLTAPGAELVDNTRHGFGFGSSRTTLAREDHGQWRFTAGNSRATLGGLWGASPELITHLDPTLGGGQVSIQVDRPLDHLVVWANDLVFSPEPKLCRLWLDGERAAWTIRYRFQP